jgi:glycosyltransferase involved in cell wall biosynthesis
VRVLYFGTYERDYPRNAQVISCLRAAGVEVVEHHIPVWEGQEHKFGLGPRSAARLVAGELRLLRRPREEFDVLVVGYPGHFDMRLARRAAGRRPLVFNPLLSLYDSLVLDRGRWADGSLPGRLLRGLDRDAIRLADLTVADTAAHADYFATLAGVPRQAIDVCFVGAEERLFRPGWAPSEPFHCLSFGKLIPLHGLETILEAIRLTPEIRYELVGSGQMDDVLERGLPANAAWRRWVEYERLPDELHAAGCSLGIFGTTAKASRVIPNKAFEALACGTPLVTADTPAARELLVDGESAVLVPPGDAPALAAAVRRVRDDMALARRIGDGGLRVYREKASEAVLGERWRTILERVVAARRA